MFSILLPLFTYSFFYSCAYIGFLNKYEKCINSRKYEICKEDNSGAADTLKDCGISFALLIGPVNLGIGGFLKDFIIPAMNAVIYLGFLIYFYSIKGEEKKTVNPPFIEGFFDIILFCCSLAEIAFIIYLRFKNGNNHNNVSTPLTISE